MRLKRKKDIARFESFLSLFITRVLDTAIKCVYLTETVSEKNRLRFIIQFLTARELNT